MPSPEKTTNVTDNKQGFDEFWQRYPSKVGKLAARKEYERAVKVQGATQAELLAGVDRYIEQKPIWMEWAHPRTWLHQGRWMDEYKTPAQRPPSDWLAQAEGWFDECKRLHGGACGLSQTRHEQQKRIDAGKAERNS